MKNSLHKLFVVLFLFFIGDRAFAELSPARALKDSARTSSLATDPQWHTFLHYDRVFPFYAHRTRSEGKNFFLSSDGGSDPGAELDATIDAMFASADLGDEHAQCKFPARFEWLKSKLSFPADMPRPICAKLLEWYAALDPVSVTVIFPASFLNNPASAFGHTFIRLDQANQNEETRLLAYAADYAAATSGEDALSYAVKGVFGGYSGFYSVTPYYKKVTKYSDLENRDIWEYELALSPDEVRRLTLHLWELKEIPFTYFYFDENCSYHILGLLDVARPTLHLASSFKAWVLPIDTVRELLEHPALLRDRTFRPSAATKLRHRISQTSTEAQRAAFALSSDTSNSASPTESLKTDEERARAYDLGYDYLTYERIKKRDDSEEGRNRSWDLLSKRSKLPKASIAPIVAPAEPERGHKTALISAGTGLVKDKAVGEFIFRPAFHALTDSQPGYIPGAQIVFFESAMRLREGEGVAFERFTPLNITSLTPRDRFFHPISWQVNLEARRNETLPGAPVLSELNAGGGRSYQLLESVLVYGLFNGDLQLSGVLEDNYALGAGPRAGIIVTPNDWLATELRYDLIHFPFGDDRTRSVMTATQRISMSRDTALRIDITHREDFDRSALSAIIRVELFFTP